MCHAMLCHQRCSGFDHSLCFETTSSRCGAEVASLTDISGILGSPHYSILRFDMYSTLFRELCASRLHPDMNCTEPPQLVSADRVTPTEDVAPAAILEQHLNGVNYQQYYATFSHPTNDIAPIQTPAGWGSVPGGPYAYNGVGLSSSPASLMPFGFCLPGYLPASDATRPLACDCEVGQRVCDGQTDFGYHDGVMDGHLATSHNETAATSIQHQLQEPSWVTHRPPRLGTFDWRSYEDDSYECSADQAECIIPTAVSSSSSSSSPSPSSLSSSYEATTTMAVTSTSQCPEQLSGSSSVALTRSSQTNEDDRREGSFSPDRPRGFPPHQQGRRLSSPSSHRGVAPSSSPVTVGPDQHQGPLPVQIRLQAASVESSFDDDGESIPSPGFDRRRGSLGCRPSRPGGAGGAIDAPVGDAGSRLGVVAAEGAPSQARRSSIACMPATTRTLGGAAALDYESLKVKLEKLTGPVTEGTARRDGAGGSSRAALVDRRRTSIAVMAPLSHGGQHPGPIAAASGGSDEGGQRTMMRRESVSSTDNDSHAVLGHAKMDVTGTMNAMNAASDGAQQLHHTTICSNHSQESTNSLEPYDKSLSDDLSSSSSSSSSSSTTSSLCLIKFRLHCILEQILQSDARLQEIVRRHETERQSVRLKHRFQWMELENSLTRNFGDEWKRFAATVPELSLHDSTLPLPPSDGRNGSNDLHVDGTASNNNTNNQSVTEQTLETITEGLIEDSFLEVSTESSPSDRRRETLSLMPSCETNVDLVSRRYSEGNMNSSSYKRPKSRPFRRVSKQHDAPQIVQTNGDFIDARPCPSSSTPNRQCPVGIPVPSSSRLHGYTTDATTTKVLNNADNNNSQWYGLLQPVQDPRSCLLQASMTARLSQMYTQNALQALLTAQLLDANNSTVYGGFDPGLDLTGGYGGPNSLLLPAGRPACAVQELDHQVLAFPWTAPHQIQNIHSLPGLYHYQEFM